MAKGRTYRARAIVVGHTKLGEQDLILTLVGQEGQQIRAVAKGGRKPGAKLSGRCDLFCMCDLLLAHGRTLDIVTEAHLVASYPGIRGDLGRVSAASCLCEVARLSSFEDVTDPFVFAILDRALRSCEVAPTRACLDTIVGAFVLKVCSHGGWMPQLDSCVACDDEQLSRFSARAGGMLCESCAREVEGAELVGADELGWLRAYLSHTFDQLEVAHPDEPCAARLLALVHVWGVTCMDTRLRALEFHIALP